MKKTGAVAKKMLFGIYVEGLTKDQVNTWATEKGLEDTFVEMIHPMPSGFMFVSGIPKRPTTTGITFLNFLKDMEDAGLNFFYQIIK